MREWRDVMSQVGPWACCTPGRDRIVHSVQNFWVPPFNNGLELCVQTRCECFCDKVWTRVVRVVKYFKYPAKNLLLTFRRVAKTYYSRFVE